MNDNFKHISGILFYCREHGSFFDDASFDPEKNPKGCYLCEAPEEVLQPEEDSIEMSDDEIDFIVSVISKYTYILGQNKCFDDMRASVIGKLYQLKVM